MTSVPKNPLSAKDLTLLFENHPRAEQCIVATQIRDATQQSLFVSYEDTMVSRLGMEWLDNLADEAGWYRTRIRKDKSKTLFFYEPKNSIAVARPSQLYHATRTINADKIINFGFNRTKVGRTWMNRIYFTERVFFATQLNDAIDFIRSMKQESSSNTNINLSKKDLEEWDILKVDPGIRNYYQGAEFTNSVWTDEHVPKEDVSKLDGWRRSYGSSVDP